ncbi:MAG: hypothetical protein EOM80_04500 [Erysipelotrichia bacterium]|nr:hypothetical protein [Erysipelotrichia bacterium]
MLNSILTKLSENHRYLLFILWFLLICTFASVLEADYVLFDEDKVILENPLITAPLSGDALVNILTTFNSNQYAPLSALSFWLEYNIFGFNSAVSHLINLLLHIVCATIVYFIALLLTENALTSWLIAALWSLHPVQVESVAWVLERRNLLHGMFYFASLAAYLRYLVTARRAHILLATVFMLFSGLSKTLAFFLPFCWLLIDWLKARHLSWKLITEKLPAFVLAAVLLFITLYAAHGGIADSGQGILNWRIAAYNISFYVAKALLPLNFSATYEINRFGAETFVGAYFYFALCVVFALFICRRRRLVAFAVLFYLFHILPLSGLVRVGYQFYAALHFMYIPLLGIIIAAVALLKDLQKAWQKSAFTVFAGLLAVMMLATISYDLCHVWYNTETLFKHCLKHDPNNGFARRQLANYLEMKMRFDEAALNYRELIAHYPNFYVGYHGLGRVLMTLDKTDKALRLFDKALQCDPRRADVLCDRGYILFLDRKYRAAENDFSQSLAYKENQNVRFLRSSARRHQGDYSGALGDMALILAVDTENFAAKIGLFELFVEGGRWLQALEIVLSIFSQIADHPQKWDEYREAFSTPSFSLMLSRMMPYNSLITHRLRHYKIKMADSGWSCIVAIFYFDAVSEVR